MKLSDRPLSERARAVPAREDYGLFGPESVTWRVFRCPTSFTVGFQRTVVVEMLEPFLLASVADTGAVQSRPAARYDRTLQYVSTVAFHDSATAVRTADTLMRIHRHIRGIEPISGGEYDANAPAAQLWIHLTQWHSVLLAYEMFGPGPLTDEEDRQYWAECRRAAELQTIDPTDVPADRRQMREYYERMRGRLAATQVTQEIVGHLLNAGSTLGADLHPMARPISHAFATLSRKATIATLPGWLRQLAGVRQSRATDHAVTAVMRALVRLTPTDPRVQLALIRRLSPATADVVGPALRGETPTRPETVAPQDAWRRLARPTPQEQYEQQCRERDGRPATRAPKDAGTSKLVAFS